MSPKKKKDMFEIFLNMIVISALLVFLWLFVMIIMLFIEHSDELKVVDKKAVDNDVRPTQLESLNQQSVEQPQTVEKTKLESESESESELEVKEKEIKTKTQAKTGQQVTEKQTTEQQAIEQQEKRVKNAKPSPDLSKLSSVIFDCAMPVSKSADNKDEMAKLVFDDVTNPKSYNDDLSASANISGNVSGRVRVNNLDNLEIIFQYAYVGKNLHPQAVMSIEKVAYIRPINAYVLLLKDSIYYYRFVQFDPQTLKEQSKVAGMMTIYTKKSHNLINHYNCSSSSVLNLDDVITELSGYTMIELDAWQAKKFLNF